MTLGTPTSFQLLLPLPLPTPECSHFVYSKSLLCSACHLSINLGCSSPGDASLHPAWLLFLANTGALPICHLLAKPPELPPDSCSHVSFRPVLGQACIYLVPLLYFKEGI